MKYMILLCGSQGDYDAMAGKPGSGKPAWTGADFAALGTFMEAFNRELAESGELVETRGLTAPAYARRIRLQDGAPVITDGPFPESKELLAGYRIVDVESAERAVEIAAMISAAPGADGAPVRLPIEVRAVMSAPDPEV